MRSELLSHSFAAMVNAAPIANALKLLELRNIAVPRGDALRPHWEVKRRHGTAR